MTPYQPLSCVVIRPATGLLPWQLACVDLLTEELDVSIAGWVTMPASPTACDDANAATRWLDSATRPRSARDRRIPAPRDARTQRAVPSCEAAAKRCLSSEDINWIRAHNADFVLAFDIGTRLYGRGTLARAGVWQFSEDGALPGAKNCPGLSALACGDTRFTLSLWATTDAYTASAIIARGHTPIVPHSRKRSLARLYEIAPDLLRRAVRDMRSGDTPALSTPVDTVKIHQPVGWPRFLAAMLRETLRRWFEKLWLRQRWDIGLIKARTPIPSTQQIASARWLAGPTTGFWADPCFVAGADTPVLLVEEYRDHTGKGQITRLDWAENDVSAAPTAHTLLSSREHLSFPRSYTHAESCWLVPEMAACGEQLAYRLEKSGHRIDVSPAVVQGLAGIDPVIFAHAGRYWAFISSPGRRSNYQLDLYMADDFLGPFRSHPASPVRIDPHGGRSAGPVIREGSRLLRFGQVFGRHYGEAIDVFEITDLTPKHYAECRVDRIRPAPRTGIGVHTIDFASNLTVIDRFRLEPTWRLILTRWQASRVR